MSFQVACPRQLPGDGQEDIQTCRLPRDVDPPYTKESRDKIERAKCQERRYFCQSIESSTSTEHRKHPKTLGAG